MAERIRSLEVILSIPLSNSTKSQKAIRSATGLRIGCLSDALFSGLENKRLINHLVWAMRPICCRAQKSEGAVQLVERAKSIAIFRSTSSTDMVEGGY